MVDSRESQQSSERARDAQSRGFDGVSDDADVPSGAAFDGEDFLYHLYRGSELLQDNCVAEAKEELERALALQPRDVEGHGLLGVVYFRLGLYPRAIQIYEDIIRACPTEITPQVNLALCYLKTGQQQRARELLEGVVDHVRDHKRAWGYLGLVYERLGDYEKAEAAFEYAGQHNLARRMQQLSRERLASPDASAGAAGAEMRQAAAAAVDELDAGQDAPPFSPAEQADDSPARSGRWTAVELGQGVPRESGTALDGRFGPAVPPLPDADVSGHRGDSLPAGVPATAAASIALRAVHTPSDLARTHALDPSRENALVSVALRTVVVPVEQEFAVRLDAVRTLMPSKERFKTRPAARRNRGKETSEPLGGPSSPLVWLMGSGHVLICAAERFEARTIELSSELLYIRESRLVGFENTLRYENGRLANLAGPDIPIVQLSGAGRAVVEIPRMRALPVRAERPLMVRADDVIGWTGRMLGQPVSAEQAPGNANGFIGFVGDGAVFVAVE